MTNSYQSVMLLLQLQKFFHYLHNVQIDRKPSNAALHARLHNDPVPSRDFNKISDTV